VTSNDLWAVYENYYFEVDYALKENVPFTNFIESWTNQAGYPVVTVTKNQNTYTLTYVSIRSILSIKSYKINNKNSS